MGPLRFAIFYLLCGSIAGLTHLLTNPDSIVPSVGASGAIAGVLGAYLLFFSTARLIVLFPIFFFPFFFEVPAVLYLGLWFFIQLFSGTAALAGPEQVGGIAWWAHIGGFLSGMLLCGLFARKGRALQADEGALEWAWEPRRR
jgi:membrane associated rhomboid family serine protease